MLKADFPGLRRRQAAREVEPGACDWVAICDRTPSSLGRREFVSHCFFHSCQFQRSSTGSCLTYDNIGSLGKQPFLHIGSQKWASTNSHHGEKLTHLEWRFLPDLRPYIKIMGLPSTPSLVLNLSRSHVHPSLVFPRHCLSQLTYGEHLHFLFST